MSHFRAPGVRGSTQTSLGDADRVCGHGGLPDSRPRPHFASLGVATRLSVLVSFVLKPNPLPEPRRRIAAAEAAGRGFV